MLREEFTGNAQGPRETLLPPVPAGRPWGFWATLGFGALAMALGIAALFAVSFLGMILMTAFQDSGLQSSQVNEAYGNEAIMVLAYGVFCTCMILFVFLFASLRRGMNLTAYLALNTVPLRNLALWLGVALVLKVAYLLLCAALNLPLACATPGIFRNDSGLVRLAFALPLLDAVSAALYFQGFLFAGFQSSRIGTPGAIVLIAAIYMALCMGNSAHEMIQDMTEMLLVTTARWHTKSLYPVMSMVALTAMLESAAILLLKLPVA
ncbi:MAG: hypothetical protein IT365_21155 [Candidatus Hydrogenedentes bacterium]|nr:hypothetical protein [Candidatus Hydrogenedentota bacterium]